MQRSSLLNQYVIKITLQPIKVLMTFGWILFGIYKREQKNRFFPIGKLNEIFLRFFYHFQKDKSYMPCG